MYRWFASLQSGFVAASILLAAAPAAAQETDYEAIVRIMRECAKIADLQDRAACYDNTVNAERLIAGSPAPEVQSFPETGPATDPSAVAGLDDQRTPAAPRQSARVAARSATDADEASSGFGAESLPPSRRAGETERAENVRLAVLDADRIEPGIYLLTLEDGSQWRFVDAVPWSYDAPREGSRIELSRAALGSFQMRFESQRPVRILRVR